MEKKPRPRRVGYAKLGRSMPLALENCGSLGGDIEMVPTLKLLAERHPDVEFILVGRNSGELPRSVGLPDNVYNPWIAWQPSVRTALNAAGLNYPNLSIEDHKRVLQVLMEHTGGEFTNLDGIVMWLGQHGTTNTPLPSIKDRTVLTKPYDWATLYGSYLLQGINSWRDPDPLYREEVLLNSDARNYVKYRDSRWPWRHSVLAQYSATNKTKHERYELRRQFFDQFRDAPDVSMARHWGAAPDQWLGYEHDGDLWHGRSHSAYARLEISALIPGTPFGDTVRYNEDFNREHAFGMVVNETRREVTPRFARRTILRDWVLPLDPGFIHGKWSPTSLRELGVSIAPISQLDYIPKLQTTLTTFTTPASGSGWATAKPWESFAAGVVCFFHPAYDNQDNILGDAPAELRKFLRVETPTQLKTRIRDTVSDPETWRWAVRLQREHFERAVEEKWYLKLIESRLGLS